MHEKESLMLSSSSILNITKSEIKTIASDFVARVLEGEEDHLKALVAIKKGSELFKELESQVRQAVSGKIKLQKGEELSMFNATITEKESGVKYDFSYCEDGEWDSLNREMETIKAKLKIREDFLKTLRKEFIDEDTGEVIQPPLRTGSLGYQISIKK
ncbi:hypothetical protein E2P86_08070 [Sphingobacterium psychroaquaticum]|uniref:hypothetical protein n=1 Tax=Sphingobacterium psychroaquaticum TaxID=561061 RepID=UPI00106B9EEB|nr:hypothetical protein [Sphingobacterium psychroaquaticum]QBQ41113.1 hypothetical protein E2P86_08070 [Sphingobacterium psychroaquaticum]